MRPGVSWKGQHAELFEEAMRAVPAVARHRANGDQVSTAATFHAYLREASDRGISGEAAWAVLASAYSVWMQNLFTLYAAECDVPVLAAVDDAITSTTEWAANRG